MNPVLLVYNVHLHSIFIPTMSIIVNQISKQFGTFQALHPLSLEIPTGKLVALLGPNGNTDGWFELQLTGQQQAIDAAINYLNELGMETWTGENITGY